MKEHKFVIKQWTDIHDLLSVWFRFPMLENGIEIIIRPFKRKRSNPQNRYYWDLLNQISDQVEI